MIRVAYLCADPGVPVFGQKGSTLHVQEIIRALRALGADVEIFASRFDGEPPADLASIPLHQLPRPPKGDLAMREQQCLAANADLRRALEDAGTFDLIYERYSLWSHAGMEYARDSAAAGVLEVNAPLIEEQATYRGLIDRAGAERTAERAFGAAKVIAAVSRPLAGYLERHPAARGRVHVVPNGTNPTRFPPGLAPTYPGGPGSFTIGFLGHLKPWHGLPVLIEAFATLHAAHPETRLLIVGDGPEREALTQMLATRGVLAAVRFAGHVATDEVPGLLASMDVAVAPYPPLDHFYFSPLKLFEYMAAGLPIVASRIGQLEELIEDGVTGLLCQPGDAGALASAIGRLRASPELRTRIGAAARETALKKHTWEAVAGRILTLAGLEPAAHAGAQKQNRR